MSAFNSKKFFLLPMDGIPVAVLDAVRDALAETYGLDVVVLKEVPLPVSAFNVDRHQHLSLLVIEDIARMDLGASALGIASEDFYAQGLNFVFGEADVEKAVAVISLARLRREFYGGQPDERLLVERAVKEAVHEVGHLMGLPHCADKGCVMHFSNTISHTDLKSPKLCAMCKRTLESAFRMKLESGF